MRAPLDAVLNSLTPAARAVMHGVVDAIDAQYGDGVETSDVGEALAAMICTMPEGVQACFYAAKERFEALPSAPAVELQDRLSDWLKDQN